MPLQTYDVEIKAQANSQRAVEAESTAEIGAYKWTTEGAVKGFCRVFRNAVRALIARIFLYPQSVRFFRELRWQRGGYSPSLWQIISVAKGGFFV